MSVKRIAKCRRRTSLMSSHVAVLATATLAPLRC